MTASKEKWQQYNKQKLNSSAVKESFVARYYQSRQTQLNLMFDAYFSILLSCCAVLEKVRARRKEKKLKLQNSQKFL